VFVKTTYIFLDGVRAFYIPKKRIRSLGMTMSLKHLAGDVWAFPTDFWILEHSTTNSQDKHLAKHNT